MYDRQNPPRRRDEIVQRRAVPAVLAAAALLLTAGCSSGDGAPPEKDSAASSAAAAPSSPSGKAEETPPAKGSVSVVRTVATGLDSPWGLAPVGDGDLLVSSRDEATITRIDGETGKKTELGEVPGVAAEGEGGLLGIALSPDFASDHMIYAYFTSASDNRIVRMLYNERKPAGEQLGAPDTVFRGIPKGVVHNGGRIAFGPDRMLYAGTGETGDTGLAQDKKSLGGKILRLTPDGEPAPNLEAPRAGISVPRPLGRRQMRDLRQVLAGQPQPGRSRVLRHPPLPLGARHRDHVAAAAQHPGQGDLRRGDVLSLIHI